MTPRIVLISLFAALFLTACNDETAEAPNEYDVGASEEAAPADEPVSDEPVSDESVADGPAADDTITITLPSPEAVRDTVSETAGQVAEQAGEIAGQALEAADNLRERAADEINELTDGREVGEVASEALETATTAIRDQVDALTADAPAIDLATDEQWQSTYAAEVPFYNLGEQAVDAYDSPQNGDVVASIGPGEGGYIESCNATLDWCALSIGDGSTVWVDMEAFGGVAN